MPGKTVGEILSALADDQLKNERALKESLAGRSAVVITSAGTLVTLLLGGIALITGQGSYRVSTGIIMLVAIAMALLIVASLIALVVNSPWRQTEIRTATMGDEYSITEWESIDDQLAKNAYDLRVGVVNQLRASNRMRSWCLTIALGLECVALIVLSVAAESILTSGK
jgi:hypothetical protein